MALLKKSVSIEYLDHCVELTVEIYTHYLPSFMLKYTPIILTTFMCYTYIEINQ